MDIATTPGRTAWIDRLLERWSARDAAREEGPVAGPEPTVASVEAEDGGARAQAQLEIDPGPEGFGFYHLEAGAEGDEALAVAELELSTDADPDPELALRAVAGRLEEDDGSTVAVAHMSLKMEGSSVGVSIDGGADGFQFALGLGSADDAPLGVTARAGAFSPDRHRDDPPAQR